MTYEVRKRVEFDCDEYQCTEFSVYGNVLNSVPQYRIKTKVLTFLIGKHCFMNKEVVHEHSETLKLSEKNRLNMLEMA